MKKYILAAVAVVFLAAIAYAVVPADGTGNVLTSSGGPPQGGVLGPDDPGTVPPTAEYPMGTGQMWRLVDTNPRKYIRDGEKGEWLMSFDSNGNYVIKWQPTVGGTQTVDSGTYQ